MSIFYKKWFFLLCLLLLVFTSLFILSWHYDNALSIKDKNDFEKFKLYLINHVGAEKIQKMTDEILKTYPSGADVDNKNYIKTFPEFNGNLNYSFCTGYSDKFKCSQLSVSRRSVSRGYIILECRKISNPFNKEELKEYETLGFIFIWKPNIILRFCIGS